ncbi:MAG TPA: hypothetical protein VK942_01835 [Actinomycetes bacterium]|nr:hypothetical protein [Actinomycetes bacterium]
MPLTADNFVQSNSGGHDFTGNVTLPAATEVGSRLILTLAGSGTIATPSGWTRDADGGAATSCNIYSRLGDGGTSWAFDIGSTQSCEWDLFEVTGIDPDAPVDVTPQTTGLAGSTGTTDPSTTYDGLLIGIHRSVGSVGGGTFPVFGAHSTNEELSDHGHATGGAFSPISISTCRRFVQALGSFECDCDPDVGTYTGTCVLYTAEGAKRKASISHWWSFPAELAGATNLHLTGANYFQVAGGTPAITSDGLQLTGSANIQDIWGPSGLGAPLGTPYPGHVAAIRFRLDSLSGDIQIAVLDDSSAGSDVVIRYVSASQKIGVKVGTGAEVLSDATVTTATWYRIDLRARCLNGTSPHLCDWQLDYGSGPVAQAQASLASNGLALGFLQPKLGWGVNATGTITYDFAVYSNVGGHYPLGEFVFPFLKVDPAGTPTVVGTANNFRRFTANGTLDGTFIAANVRDALDEWPPVFGASADGLAVVTAHATDYCEIPMQTYDPAGTGALRGPVWVFIPVWAASATTATMRINGWDGTTSTVFWPESDPQTDNTASPPWICVLWEPTGGWTPAKLDAAAIRVGALDATPDIGPHAIGMALCVQVATAIPVFGEAAAPLRVEQDSDSTTGGILALRAYTPADQSATLVYELGGVPQTPVVIPAASNPETVVIDAADATVVTRIELQPDEPA